MNECRKVTRESVKQMLVELCQAEGFSKEKYVELYKSHMPPAFFVKADDACSPIDDKGINSRAGWAWNKHKL